MLLRTNIGHNFTCPVNCVTALRLVTNAKQNNGRSKVATFRSLQFLHKRASERASGERGRKEQTCGKRMRALVTEGMPTPTGMGVIGHSAAEGHQTEESLIC